MTNNARVLVVGAEPAFRERLIRGILAMPDFVIGGLCETVYDALTVLRRQPAKLVLLEQSRCHDAITFLPRARAAGFTGAMVLLTPGLSITEGAAFVQQGVCAICPPDLGFDALLEVMQLASKGVTTIEERYFRAATECTPMRVPELSEREWQIIYLLLDGLSNKQIAASIGMSEATVKASLQRIYDTTGVHSRSRLLTTLLRREVIKPGRDCRRPFSTTTNYYTS